MCSGEGTGERILDGMAKPFQAGSLENLAVLCQLLNSNTGEMWVGGSAQNPVRLLQGYHYETPAAWPAHRATACCRTCALLLQQGPALIIAVVLDSCPGGITRSLVLCTHPNISRMMRADSPMYLSTMAEDTTWAQCGAGGKAGRQHGPHIVSPKPCLGLRLPGPTHHTISCEGSTCDGSRQRPLSPVLFPHTLRKLASMLQAMARASRVLPVPGGPYSRTPAHIHDQGGEGEALQLHRDGA